MHARLILLPLILAWGASCDPELQDELDETDDLAEADVEVRALSVTPNDSLFPAQKWHYDAIRVPEAWSLTTGASSVLIAVADSGKLEHPELTGKWSGGYDFFSGDADPIDPGDYHHGIHVAGTIGELANNITGGAGICWNCPIRPIRVAQFGGIAYGEPGTNEPASVLLARAIRYAAGLPTDNGVGQTVQASSRADVINISIGNLPGPCPAYLNAAIDAAAAAGTAVVVSAGNGDSGYTIPPAPDFNPDNYLWTTCKNPNLIVVTAVDEYGQAEPYALQNNPSAKFMAITLAAPGGSAVGGQAGHGALLGCTDPLDPNTTGTHGVVSTWFPMGQGTPACHRHFSGTSMAAPHVSGVVALMRSRNFALTVAEIKTILERTAKSIPCATCGNGEVDAYRAVEASTFGLSIHCESTGGGGYSCSPSVTGGLGPLTATWQGLQNASVDPASVHQPGVIDGLCSLNTQARVRATFTDALGRTAVHEDSFQCTPLPP